jgi:hypothetical protein
VCCARLAPPNKLVVRIYGNKTEVMIDRVGEIAALHKLSAARRGPTYEKKKKKKKKKKKLNPNLANLLIQSYTANLPMA